MSAFRSDTGIFMSAGTAFLLSRFSSTACLRSSCPIFLQVRQPVVWVCAVEWIPAVIWVRNEPPITVYCWVTVLLNVCCVINSAATDGLWSGIIKYLARV